MATVKEHLIAAKALLTDAAVYQDKDRITGSALFWAFEQVIGPDAGKIAILFAAIENFWSGSRTHADIIALFDRAIAAQDEAVSHV